MIKLETLRTFVAVAEAGNIKDAAETALPDGFGGLDDPEATRARSRRRALRNRPQ